MFKRRILKKCRFDRNLNEMADHDFWFQVIGAKFKIRRFPKALYFYRMHSGQSSKNKKEIDKGCVIINKKLKSGVYFK